MMEELRGLRAQMAAQAAHLAVLQTQSGIVNSGGLGAPGVPPPSTPLVSTPAVDTGEKGSDKDLYKLAKMVKCVTFDPKSEKEYENVLDEWEAKSRGSGMDSKVLKSLLIHVGALRVRQAAATLEVNSIDWVVLKNSVAKLLFPFSRYRRDLEREIEEENRALPVEDTIVLLEKYRKRHSDLCTRWAQTNTLSDDRLKDALLAKMPADKVTPCLSTQLFHTFSYNDFVVHCRMITSALEVGAQATRKQPQKSGKGGAAPNVRVVDVAAANTPVVNGVGKKSAPADYRCFNCGAAGYFMNQCPKPKARCTSCGRIGHNATSCTRLHHDGPMGRTRTGFLRMTRSGIHLDLVDEATKRSLFEAMRKHLETQEESYEKAKVKAQARRDEKRAQTLLEGLEQSTPIEQIDLLEDVYPMEGSTTQDIAHAIPVDPDKRTPSHYLNMEIFNKRIPSLLDSGAAISLLPTELWEQLPPEQKESVAICEPGSQPLVGLGGTFQVDAIIDLPISVEGRALVQRFFVSPAPGSPILGMDALMNLGIHIDFSTGEVGFKGMNQLAEQVQPLGISKLCPAIEVDPGKDEPEFPFSLGEGGTEEERQQVTDLLLKFPEIWKDPCFGKCKSTLHNIDTGTATPIRSRVRRLPPDKIAEVKNQIEKLMKAGAVRPSNSPWASPIVLVPKANGTTRLCVDYRALNDVTRKDAFPLPSITELLDRLATATVFSTLDLEAGFHQIPLDETSIPKTAFITPEGLYEYCVLPFGLANAPSTFQRMTDALFRDPPLRYNIAVYIDDIVVYTPTVDRHLAILEQVFLRLKEVNLFVNLKKTTVFARKAKYLGFIVQAGQLTPDPKQIEALVQLQPPKDVPSLRRFLGLAGYFRHFIPNFSAKAIPLTRLLKKNVTFEWTNSCQEAWIQLKEELANDHVRLQLPIFGKIFYLDTDASEYALGAVLLQEGAEKQLRPVAFASRTLTAAERNWTTREQEAYAIVWGVLHFAPYLRTQPHFIVRSDHQSLRWLWRSDNKRIIRWALLLREYNFTIQHNRGGNHQHVDIFSRDATPNPIEDELTERVATRDHVFCVDTDSSATNPTFSSFPTFDDIKDAQQLECTSELNESLKLRMGAQGLYQSQGGQTYIPTLLRKPIMYYFHYGRMGAHQGVNRSFSRIRKLFFWPASKDDIQAYHAQCLTCARRRPKPPVGSRGYLLSAHISGVVAVDVVGPLTIRDQTVHFLTIIDHFSRYPHAVQLSTVTSRVIWEALYSEWISYFGAPAFLLSDNAPVFKSAELLKELSECGIRSIYPFPYHPEGNGIIESFHLFFKKALISALRLSDLPIKLILSDLLMAYRATPHISTGESPFYLMTGMDLILPGMQDWARNFIVDFGKSREEVLRHLREAAFDSTARRAVARAAMKPETNKSKPLKEGTLVLYWLNPGDKRQLESKIGTAKTMPLWSGPCRVVRKSTTREDLYIIRQIWNRGKPRTVARELLMEIPGIWGDSEAQEALKELIADLKRPKRDPITNEAKEDSKIKSRGANIDIEERGRQLLQELTATPTPTTPDSQSSKALEGQAKESPTASSSSSSRKRLRTAQCMNWVELISLCK